MICKWGECDRESTGPDGVCDHHSLDYWREWLQEQPDTWVRVSCPRCHVQGSIPVKDFEAKGLWPYKICQQCHR